MLFQNVEIIGSGISSGSKVLAVDVINGLITLSSNATTTASMVTLTTGKIVVYKSPYVQNCTNQSGPWLYDGTMFIPNQTVQVPNAVGVTTFENGAQSITVAVSEGTVQAGMSINTAPQNQGFFTFRTLILSNVQFIQEQVLEYIKQTYTNFVYDTEKCRRDIRTILEHVLYDTTFGGNSKIGRAHV